MNELPLVISVSRVSRSSDRVLRGLMAALAVFFLLQGILFSSAFMLPCFCMTAACFIYGHLARREYEYTLDEDGLKIERVSDMGRRLLHEIPYDEIRLICLADDPEAAPYKKGGSIRVKKYDYTSYRDDVPYYTLIAGHESPLFKFLLDLTPEALVRLRRSAAGCGRGKDRGSAGAER